MVKYVRQDLRGGRGIFLRGSVLVTVTLLAILLSGCFGGGSPGAGDDEETFDPTGHPWPRGDEWPTGLAGPFDLTEGDPIDVRVESHDGVEMGGWLFRPGLPEGVFAPTILLSSPYYALDTANAPNRASWGAGPIDLLVEHGFAVGAFSVRGTGVSGGCFENKGANEQQDQAVLVEWLAEQPWSNGRVGMIGISYPATTPLMAGMLNPPSLKTIVPIAPVTDPYTELHTPQGALYTMGAPNELGRRAAVSLLPTASGHDADESPVPEPIVDLASRACAGFADVLTSPAVGHHTDDRNGAYWDERRLIDGFPDVTASVFFVHGLQETAHPFQEDPAWHALTQAPKRMMLGQWDHEVPRVDDWQETAIGWLDFWLKGVGEPELVGGVEYELSDGSWRTSTAWPPAEAREEVAYLSAGALGPEPTDGTAAFRSLPFPDVPGTTIGPEDGSWPLCDAQEQPASNLVHVSEPVANDSVLAGNPFAYLTISSDQPGGLVAGFLYRVPAGGDCTEARLLTSGAADLRFHAGNLEGRDFPTNTPTSIRIDLMNAAEPVAAGDRLAFVLNRGEYPSPDEIANPLSDERFSRSGQAYYPQITVHEGADASHLVLPFVAGGLGGPEPTVDYPPRPFVPKV